MAIMELVVQSINWVGSNWFSLKGQIEHGAGINDDALHVIVGVVLQMSIAGVFRIPMSHVSPWLILLSFEVANEWSDARFGIRPEYKDAAEASEGIKDVLLTMFLPSLLFLSARTYPRLFKRDY